MLFFSLTIVGRSQFVDGKQLLLIHFSEMLLPVSHQVITSGRHRVIPSVASETRETLIAPLQKRSPDGIRVKMLCQRARAIRPRAPGRAAPRRRPVGPDTEDKKAAGLTSGPGR